MRGFKQSKCGNNKVPRDLGIGKIVLWTETPEYWAQPNTDYMTLFRHAHLVPGVPSETG